MDLDFGWAQPCAQWYFVYFCFKRFNFFSCTCSDSHGFSGNMVPQILTVNQFIILRSSISPFNQNYIGIAEQRVSTISDPHFAGTQRLLIFQKIRLGTARMSCRLGRCGLNRPTMWDSSKRIQHIELADQTWQHRTWNGFASVLQDIDGFWRSSSLDRIKMRTPDQNANTIILLDIVRMSQIYPPSCHVARSLLPISLFSTRQCLPGSMLAANFFPNSEAEKSFPRQIHPLPFF